MEQAVPFYHAPIMVEEVLSLLEPSRGGVFVDGTLGGGGHAQRVLSLLPENGHLYGIDRDEEAIAAASGRLAPFKEKFTAVHGNFFHMKSLLLSQGVVQADGILLDLGVSSYQLDNPARGFSYKLEAPLDMRMDRTAPLSAYEVVNTYSYEDLRRIFWEYGEEKFSGPIAGRILRERETKSIETTTELAEIIKYAIPAKVRNKESQHPARRCFQAIRIEVNGELRGLEKALQDAHDLLAPGGRLVVLTFHSLEDRIVKNLFRSFEKPCICSPKAPICTCGRVPTGRILTKKPLTASQQEQKENTRSQCCKLRAEEKL